MFTFLVSNEEQKEEFCCLQNVPQMNYSCSSACDFNSPEKLVAAVV